MRVGVYLIDYQVLSKKTESRIYSRCCMLYAVCCMLYTGYGIIAALPLQFCDFGFERGGEERNEKCLYRFERDE